ncbi:zinc ion binding protein [Carex rostrata]
MAADEVDISGGGAESFLTVGPGGSVTVRYHPDFGPHNDLILLEAPDEALLNDVLHGRVTIRGQTDEEAVLCTQSSTYAMKFVGTSNSLFLITNGESPNPSDLGPDPLISVLKLAPGNIELVQTAPRLDKLRFLLLQRPYKLDEEEEDCGTEGLYTWHDLISSIQASDEELREGLRSLSAMEINGFWRMVDPKSTNMVLTMVLTNLVLHDWLWDALVEEEVLSILDSDGFNSTVVKHCLETFGTKIENENQKVWCLDTKRIAVHFAKQVLGTNGGKMKLEIFIEKWMRNVLKGMSFDMNMLEGEVLFEKIGAETWIKAFSVAELPLRPDARFSMLFKERAKWAWKDLEPYVRDLRVPGVSSEGLLIKYTRRVQPNAVAEPIFSAR